MNGRQRVYIVEDNVAYAQIVERMFKDTDAVVMVTNNAADISPQLGDVVLLDLLGTDARRIRLSGNFRLITMSTCANLNPDLVKPFTREQLLSVVFGGYPTNPAAAIKAVMAYDSQDEQEYMRAA